MSKSGTTLIYTLPAARPSQQALPLSTLLRHCSRHRHWFSSPCSCQRSLEEREKLVRNAKRLLTMKPDTSKLLFSASKVAVEELVFHAVN